MKRELIGLQHLDLLTPRFSAMEVDISEYTFSNVFLFREVHRFELMSCHDLFIKGITRDGIPFIMPTVIPKELDMCRVRKILRSGLCLFPVAEEWLEYFDSKHFKYTYVDGDSDYLFTLDKMRTYAGRGLSGRRNLVKQFLSSYESESRLLNQERTEDAKQALQKWGSSKNASIDTDYEACLEGLRYFEKLRFSGKIYYVNNEPIAFLFGEPLNESVYVIHFAKADTKFKGVYQYIYQDFALGLSEEYTYINLEQDLGLPYLRRSKHAYMPDRMVKKYRVFVR